MSRGAHRAVKLRSRRSRLLRMVVVVAVLAGATLVVSGSRSPAYAAEFYPVPSSGTYTIDGHGYGHGRGMSQYGAQGRALNGFTYDQILAFYYPGTTLTTVSNLTLRVRLEQTASADVRVDAAPGTMTVRDEAGRGAAVGIASAPIRVVTTGNTQILYKWNGSAWVRWSMGGGGVYAGPISIASAGTGGTTVYRPGASSKYRGSVAVVRTGTTTSVAVNRVSLREYLYGVVPRESPASWEPAALQAQTVAARSYALRLRQDGGPSWDICDSTSCQVYGGMSSENLRTNDIVNSTQDKALYYGTGPAFTEFSSSNGGYSTPGNVPYLVAQPDPYDGKGGGPYSTWVDTVTTASLKAKYPNIGTITGLRINTRDGRGEWGGRTTSVEVVGTAGSASTGASSLGLLSSWWRPRSSHNPIGAIDVGARVANGQVRLAGWAVDPDSSDSLRVHAYVDGKATAAYTADISRPDVGTAYEKGDLHGYDFRLNLAVGVHSVCVYAINVGEGTNTRIGCKDFDMGAAPRGGINSLVLNAGTARLVGWAIDDDVPTAPVSVQVNVDGAPALTSAANVPRADVGGANPGAGNNHGFDMSLPLAVGRHEICLYAIDPGPGATNTKLQCGPVTLATDPVGNVDKIVGGATTVTVAGWAVDTDTPTAIDVQVTVDGAAAATLHASGRRTDVGVLYPGTGYAHGFTASVPVAPGNHDVCITALNVGSGSDSRLGCAPVSVGVPPIGGINALTPVIGLQSRIIGWAIDPDTTDPISVHVYVNGRVAGGLRADVNRADVGRLYPASGPIHGFDGFFTLRPGANQVCVYAINVAAGANRSLGCKSLTLPSTAANPVGGSLTVRVGSGSVTPYGWTADPDVPTTAIRTHVYVDGRPIRALTADVARADVARIYPFYGAAHGYQTTLSVAPGRHSVCVYAINQGPGTGNTTLGCRSVTVPS